MTLSSDYSIPIAIAQEVYDESVDAALNGTPEMAARREAMANAAERILIRIKAAQYNTKEILK